MPTGPPLRSAGVQQIDDDGEPRENFLERIIREYGSKTSKQLRSTDSVRDDDDDDDVDDKPLAKKRRSTSPSPVPTPISDASRKRKDRDESEESSKRRKAVVPVVSESSVDTRKRKSVDDIVIESNEGHRDKRRADMPPPPPRLAVVKFVRKRQPNMLSGTSYMLQLLQADAEEEASGELDERSDAVPARRRAAAETVA